MVTNRRGGLSRLCCLKAGRGGASVGATISAAPRSHKPEDRQLARLGETNFYRAVYRVAWHGR